MTYNPNTHQSLELPAQAAHPDSLAQTNLQTHAIQSSVHDGINQVVPVAEGPGQRDSVYSHSASHASPEMRQGPGTRNETEDADRQATEYVTELLGQIGRQIDELTSINMEHRLGDIRDSLPIFAGIRSHGRATREGQCIAKLQQLVAELQDVVSSNGLLLGLEPLLQAMSTMHVPGGITKLAASVLVFPRNIHRSWTVKRVENLRGAVSAIQDTLWESRRQSQRSNEKNSKPNFSLAA